MSMWFDEHIMGYSEVILVIMSVILIMVLMWIMSIMLDDSAMPLSSTTTTPSCFAARWTPLLGLGRPCSSLCSLQRF